MTMYDYVWVWMTICDCAWLCMTNYGFIWLPITLPLYHSIFLYMTLMPLYVWSWIMSAYVWLCTRDQFKNFFITFATIENRAVGLKGPKPSKLECFRGWKPSNLAMRTIWNILLLKNHLKIIWVWPHCYKPWFWYYEPHRNNPGSAQDSQKKLLIFGEKIVHAFCQAQFQLASSS